MSKICTFFGFISCLCFGIASATQATPPEELFDPSPQSIFHIKKIDQADELSIQLQLQKIIVAIKKATQTHDFRVLEPYVLNKKSMIWAVCYLDGDAFEEFSFDEITARLETASKNTEIIVEDEPLKEGRFYDIKTEGWAMEEPFMNFFLIYDGQLKQLKWRGLCSFPAPDPRKPYNRIPKLPRPGPRVFSSLEALSVRIEEIAQFRAWEALRAYALEPMLTVKPCTLNQEELGHIAIDALIDKLKKLHQESTDIILLPAKGAALEANIKGKVPEPYLYFVFDNSSEWRWNTVAFCNDRASWFNPKFFRWPTR
jgi:hypothetical protein